MQIAPEARVEEARTRLNEIPSFDSEQASIAAGLVKLPRAFGRSLGDRACLALALVLDAPVYTTDKMWGKLGSGLQIHLLR